MAAGAAIRLWPQIFPAFVAADVERESDAVFRHASAPEPEARGAPRL
jgi:hypothetical protein